MQTNNKLLNLKNENPFFLIFSERNLLLIKEKGQFVLPKIEHIKEEDLDLMKIHNLGSSGGVKYYCTETIITSLTSQKEFIPVKRAFDFIDDNHFPMITKGLQVIDWDKNNHFCGSCGKLTIIKNENFERHCESCGMVFYPRISPAVIVLIRKEDKVLLARGANFAPGIYGLIAGFIEPGETVEEAVYREVFEEVGLQIKNLRYIASQPWPFPDSLMLAFSADYESGEIILDNKEIVEATWFSLDNLPSKMESSKSIAWKLLQFLIEKL